MRIVSGIALAAALIAAGGETAAAQSDLGPDRWYWGAQGGAYMYKTPTQNWAAAAFGGLHWYITKNQVALEISFDQLIFQSSTSTAVPNGASASGSTTVTFDRAQRVEALLIARPGAAPGRPLELNLGGGFSINNVTNGEPVGAATGAELQTATQRINELRSAAFFVALAGVQMHMGRLALYADYRYMPASENFLITGVQHVLTGGLRYAFSASTTEIGTER